MSSPDSINIKLVSSHIPASCISSLLFFVPSCPRALQKILGVQSD